MATFNLAIVIMCTGIFFYCSNSSYIQARVIYNLYMALSPCSPCRPLCSPCWLPFVPFSTYLAPSSCDRNRPPPSQVACKLTLFAPPFTQLSLPLQIPRTPTNPTAQRPPTTTLGLFRSHYTEHLLYAPILKLQKGVMSGLMRSVMNENQNSQSQVHVTALRCLRFKPRKRGLNSQL
jgi:hypothetical protein